MAVSAAVLMTTSVLEGRGATTSSLVGGNLATLLLPAGPSNECHQIDTRPLRTRRHISVAPALLEKGARLHRELPGARLK